MLGDEGSAGATPSFGAAELAHIVDTAVNPFILIDEHGNALWASASIEEILGVPASALVGRSMLDIVTPSSAAAAAAALGAAVEDGRQGAEVPAAWEGTGPVLELRRADGSVIACSIAAATPARTGLPCFVLQLRRADASVALERALLAMAGNRPLREVLREVANVLEGDLPDAEVVILHHDHDLGSLVPTPPIAPPWPAFDLEATAQPVWKESLASPGKIVERAVEELDEPLRSIAEQAGFRWLTQLGTAPVVDDDLTTAAVVTVWSRSPYRMHFLNHDRLSRCAGLMSMALRWEYGRRALEWAATHDGLTGLHNRASFLAQLQAARRQRRATDQTAVLYLDLDDFKPVNDAHGHTLGDHVLVEVASRLRAAVRPADVVARLGGDEFAVLCAGLDDLEVAEQLADRLVRQVSEPMVVDGIEVRVGLSVGIARLDDDVERVLSRADDALRAAKGGGKARWRVG